MTNFKKKKLKRVLYDFESWFEPVSVWFLMRGGFQGRIEVNLSFSLRTINLYSFRNPIVCEKLFEKPSKLYHL